MQILRVLLRLFLGLLLLALLPFVAWFIANRFDEAPIADERVWNAPVVHAVPDSANAWLYLHGIGAADGEDPIAFGRRRIDAYEARVRIDPNAKPGAAEQALAIDPLPFAGPDGVAQPDDALCVIRSEDCVAWAAKNRDMLAVYERVNALRIDRFQTLLGMQAFEEPFTPSLDDPVPDLADAKLSANLIARDIAAGADREHTLHRLERGVAFWRMVGARGESIFPKLASDAMIENHWRLLDALSDRLTRRQHDALAGGFDAIMAAPSTDQADLRSALRSQFRRVGGMIRHGPGGPLDALLACPKSKEPCLKSFLMASSYAPQATLNEYARYTSAAATWFDAGARDYEDARLVYGAVMTRAIPVAKNTRDAWDLFKYNGTGKILAYLAVPKLDWAGRKHDREGLRRMFALKFDARRRGLAPAAIPGFLASQPEERRNPYTGEAFGWDAAQGAITFKPSTDYWKSELLAVRYSTVR